MVEMFSMTPITHDEVRDGGDKLIGARCINTPEIRDL